jgi:hypothetical protein
MKPARWPARHNSFFFLRAYKTPAHIVPKSCRRTSRYGDHAQQKGELEHCQVARSGKWCTVFWYWTSLKNAIALLDSKRLTLTQLDSRPISTSITVLDSKPLTLTLLDLKPLSNTLLDSKPLNYYSARFKAYNYYSVRFKAYNYYSARFKAYNYYYAAFKV